MKSCKIQESKKKARRNTEYEAFSTVRLCSNHYAVPSTILCSELCWRKAMVVYTKPQQGKKEESKRLRGERVRSSLLIFDFHKETL